MSDLVTPLTLPCGLTLPDRIAMAPLTNTQSNDDGTLGEDEHRWLLRRAQGGFGWLNTCAAYVSPEGKAWKGQLGIASDLHSPGLSRLATDLRRAGALPFVQLHHAGAVAGQAPQRLSTVDAPGVRGADDADLRRVVDDFVQAALRAQEAGFVGVELHGANGYLFTQFLAPADNPRTDAYGGSLDNRARLLRETMRAVRAAVSPGFAVGVRLSPVDLYARRGLLLDDSLQVGRWLADDGADFVHLSLSDALGTPPRAPDDRVITTAFREALPPSVALCVVGDIWTRDRALAVRRAGADVVVLGRASIAHPDWPRASARPDFTPMRPPWTRDYLRSQDVGPALLHYLEVRPGTVVGGAPARG